MQHNIQEGTRGANAGHVKFTSGRGGLPMLEINTPSSTAHIYLHGAHVTHFQKRGKPPLLFLSENSRFQPDQAIRGGIPVIFPWFGPREGAGLHGFARVKAWELKEIAVPGDGSVTVRFRLPDCPEAEGYPAFELQYVVRVGEELGLELTVTNKSADRDLEFEACLHTYFSVADITAVAIRGLKGVSYLDKVANMAKKTETEDAIRISSEVDRVYLDATGAVEIEDGRLNRVIRVQKENSASTVVWNPWIAKAKAMPDFGDEEYKTMVCVESGNVGPNKTLLPPTQTSSLKVSL